MRFSSFMRRFGLLAALVPAILGCGTQVDQALSPRIGGLLASPTEEALTRNLNSFSARERALLLQTAFGDSVINISPESEAALFSNIESFTTGVLAPLIAANPRMLQTVEGFLGNEESLRARGAGAALLTPLARASREDLDAWIFLGATTRVSVSLLRGSKIRDRTAAIRQRVGEEVFEAMAPASIRDLIWNDATFNRFLTDRQFAQDFVFQASITDSLFQDVVREDYAVIELRARNVVKIFNTSWPPTTSSRTGT